MPNLTMRDLCTLSLYVDAFWTSLFMSILLFVLRLKNNSATLYYCQAVHFAVM